MGEIERHNRGIQMTARVHTSMVQTKRSDVSTILSGLQWYYTFIILSLLKNLSPSILSSMTKPDKPTLSDFSFQQLNCSYQEDDWDEENWDDADWDDDDDWDDEDDWDEEDDWDDDEVDWNPDDDWDDEEEWDEDDGLDIDDEDKWN